MRCFPLLVALAALAGCGSAGPRTDVPPDSVILGVNYIGVSVSDLDRAEDYYSSSVATETVDEDSLAPTAFAGLDTGELSPAKSRLIRSANAQLRLMQFDQRSPAATRSRAVPVYGPGIAHVCFQVAQQTNAYARILAAGARPIGAPELVQLNEKNPVHYGYVVDPEGIITEIEEVDVAKLDLPQPPRNTHRIRHVSLATPDLGRLIEFYSAFLGGQEARHVGGWWPVSGEKLDMVSGESDAKLEMAWFQVRNLELEIFQYHSHNTQLRERSRPIDAPGYNMIMFDVSDIAAASKRLTDGGGVLVGAPRRMDGGVTQFGRDPDGNLLGLQQVDPGTTYSSRNFANNGL
ncbi:VOC family protein [Qipengyuania flava]|uniref:VOC family protein n=1 Tax=Qipengyuania flava TaxID=192812 RepID=UPI00273F72B4|nr:VOC family protein [Qipengyuania flava]